MGPKKASGSRPPSFPPVGGSVSFPPIGEPDPRSTRPESRPETRQTHSRSHSGATTPGEFPQSDDLPDPLQQDPGDTPRPLDKGKARAAPATARRATSAASSVAAPIDLGHVGLTKTEQHFSDMMYTLQRQMETMQRNAERRELAAIERERLAAERIALLEQELREERDRIRSTLEPDVARMTIEASPTPGPPRSTKMTKPPVLTDGKDPTFDAWLFRIKDRLENNSDHYPDARSQMGFIASFCGGKAERHLLPRLREGSRRPFRTPEEMLDFLAVVFHNPNRLADAKSEFRALTMRGYDFDTFITEFMHLAGESELPEDDYKFELNEKLEPRLAQAVASEYVTSGSFDQFSRHCSLVARSLKRAADRLPRHTQPPPRAGSVTPSASRSTPAGSVTPSASRSAPSASRSAPSASRFVPPASGGRSPEPSLPATGPRRPPKDDPVKAELYRQGRCFNCKQKGHLARDCPWTPEQKRGDIKAIQPTSAPQSDLESENGDP